MAPAPRTLDHDDGIVALFLNAVAQKVTLLKRGISPKADIFGLSICGVIILFPLALCLIQAYKHRCRSPRRTLRFVHTDHELDQVSPTPDEEAPPQRPEPVVARNDRYIPNALPEIISFVRNDPRPPPPYPSRHSSQDHLLPHAVQ